MPERSKRIMVHNAIKLALINPESLHLIEKYKIDMSIRDLSEKTVYNYLNDLDQWLLYIYDNQFNQSIKDIKDDDITEYIYWCKVQGNNVERIKRRMSSISALYLFLQKKRLVLENPMTFVDRPKKGSPVVIQTFLTEDQVKLLREKLADYGDLQLKTYAFFSLSTMARVNAVANLKWKQVNLEDRICHDVLEKEGKIVDLFFSEEVKTLLQELIEYRGKNNINDYGWVFITGKTTDTHCTNATTICDWCKKIGRMIEVPTLHPHDWRHSGATLLKNKGMALEDISSLLNHEGTDVTKKFYIKEDPTRLSAEKDKFSI